MPALLASFIAGLMIGRTPEYLGKKIEAHEISSIKLIHYLHNYNSCTVE